MLKVILSDEDLEVCVNTAKERMSQSKAQGLNYAKHTGQRDLQTRLKDEIVGAAGELAVARFLGIDQELGINTFHTVPDVGGNIEVRTTTREDGRLVVRNNDSPSRLYVLVTGTPPEMVIRGAIMGADARRPEWLWNPHNNVPSWFVPQSALEK